ncbi:MAG TPA: PQQ-binding-like beta-propeller repeat protein [Gemmataceae bacterium]|nr:PQQ-binding-like beta-propeller repeat protein [Gemmataceae bacterium]
MSTATPGSLPVEPRLRLWPGVVLVVIQWACLKVPGLVFPGTMAQFMFMFFGPIATTILFVVWWLFFSRARWSDRGLGLGAAVALGAISWFFFHPSIGFMGLTMFAIPVVTTAWIGWLLLTSSLGQPVRRMGFAAVLVLAWIYPTLLRMDGVDGSFTANVNYRWQPTGEELFLEEMAKKGPAEILATAPEAKPVIFQPGDWPGFRGPDRDSRLPGVRIATDWQQRKPKLLWKQRVGPGWSSFAVIGNRLYTQEQRDKEEAVLCYEADSGKEIWEHRDSARFAETVSGPGPRATPTFYEGRIYSLGATGRLNCLDAASGKLVWTHDIVADSGAETPMWGLSSSPLVAKGIVTVFAGGPEGKSVLGYNASAGDLAWSAGAGKLSYGSTHLLRVGGVEAVMVPTEVGLTAFEPLTGKVVWQHDWANPKGMPRVVQPSLVGDSDILFGTVDNGMRRVRVLHQSEVWETNEIWTTKAIKPYFSDFVVHKDHAYGFDGIFFTCVDLADGKAKWKARGYGSGQVLLLPDQELLLILSEKGEGALVQASPETHKELCRMPMIKGKTWNHPVLAHGKLFVRNDEEAACYQLNEEGTTTGSGAGK